ncbi:hypothetical protein AB205_0214020 [Aquarana catesbeiana]|uniref:Replication factor C C-terminal domain-containing protein n=1 Tax=Aquarana catesbeiana TaxID=8400 RepID=A0A2G9RP09_AQUCT|nr:hypothetical protein AB205_0214020 [Aquarana catesbeiana]
MGHPELEKHPQFWQRPGSYMGYYFMLSPTINTALAVLAVKNSTFFLHSSFLCLDINGFVFVCSGKPCPPFKIVILDEADSMTSAAQAALRRTMEKESKTTRFCLICNYVSRIIEPLTSRCSKFRFKPLADKIQTQRILDICTKENLLITNEAVSRLAEVSEGDLRKAITFLQSATRLTAGKEITDVVVTEIAGVISKETLNSVLAACQSGLFEKLETVVMSLINNGHAATQLVNQFHDLILEREDLTDKQKAAIAEKLAEVDKCLVDGADEYLQMLSLFAVVMQQMTQNN